MVSHIEFSPGTASGRAGRHRVERAWQVPGSGVLMMTTVSLWRHVVPNPAFSPCRNRKCQKPLLHSTKHLKAGGVARRELARGGRSTCPGAGNEKAHH